jgi:hypothetical protein
MNRIIKHPLNGTKDDFGWRYLDTKINLTMPWYTIGCLEWLITLNLSELSVFEYGCGLSSLWWKQQCKKWNGVDVDSKWNNNAIITTDENTYIKASTDSLYDIIIIDGSYRDNCTEYALKSINKTGYIICDNWDQTTADTSGDYWNKTKKILSKYEMKVYKEPEHIDWKTAVFYIK